MSEEKKMPGYTGFRPQFANEGDECIKRDNRFYIPGKSSYLTFNTEYRLLRLCPMHQI